MRLIDAEKLWMVTEGEHEYYERFEVDDAPTVDAVPVIRCKDCAEWRLAGDGEGECYDGMADGALTHETDFCSWARRRTDD